MTDERPVRVHAEQVMGTVVSIAVRPPSIVLPPDRLAIRRPPRTGSHDPRPGRVAWAAPDLDAAVAAATARLHRADEDFSTFRAGSWVSRLRRGEIGLEDCPGHVREVYRLADACRGRSGGWFDPAWRGDGTLDPTGLVKGWAADVASAALTTAGVTDHCVNAAGDLRLRGTPGPGRSWRVGIADPFHRDRVVAVVEGTDLAVATSGAAEQGSHVLNPRTGAPATDLASVTVVGPDLAMADAYATAGLAAGRSAPELLNDLVGDGWEWLTVDSAGGVDSSAGFRGQPGQAGGPSPRASATREKPPPPRSRQ
ncbi:FAD:protein FMN transferase [Pseudofrankia sp. BMG5.36]|uniref:FAD:protein FMN transferase n=1 Tax=Pseudofrankia sp. BMG5.36 TaxID=1834512 RepID=UPI0009F236E5|nr:FAD:protein FMN transferase [Pseudofrankia sp. BMG5.36]